MRILVTEKISPHRFKTPEGYLICTDCILSRTGKQTYRRSEIFDTDDDSEVDVDRTEEEVFSDKALASFENKPIAIDHPDEDINIDNYKDYAVGFVRDIHRGKDEGQDVMLGTLVVTDKDAIEKIESGDYQQLSCGYECDIIDESNPQQKNIRGNHVALCECGRAGNARIVDSKIVDGKELNEFKKLLSQLSKMYSNDPGIEYVMKVLRDFGYDVEIDTIDGWNANRNVPGEQIKIYKMSVLLEGKEHHFITKLYADEGRWRVKEINAYMLDSINDSFAVTTLKKFMSGNTRYERYCSTLEEAIREKAALERADGQSYVIVNIKSKRRVDSMKDADYSKKTSQGYDVVAMYRDGGRLHVIFKRANDYGIGLGYDTTDGEWAQGRYDFSTLEKARDALMEEKPYAKRIQDCMTDESIAARGYAYMINTYSMNKAQLEKIVNKIKYADDLSKDEKEKLTMKANSLINSLEHMEDSVKDEESTYAKVTKELKKNEQKDSLKEYRVKDSKGKTYKVKADSVEAAMKIIKQFKDSKKK